VQRGFVLRGGLIPVAPPTTLNVRYMVHDVDAAIAWYTTHLGFTVLSNAAPAFADVALGSLRLLLTMSLRNCPDPSARKFF
jgi:hypothetical protein